MIFDTGVIFAAMDRSEPLHRQCADLFLSAADTPIIPSPVLVEVDFLVSSRLRTDAAFLELLRSIEIGAVEIANLVTQDYERIAEIMLQYHDLDVGFVDAAVLAVCERLHLDSLATLDRRHFSVMRPRHVDALRLLPEL